MTTESRKDTDGETKKPDSSAGPGLGKRSSSIEDIAAEKIQAGMKRFRAKLKSKEQQLWLARNELDMKEENDLMQSHDTYEALKTSALKGRGSVQEEKEEQEQGDEEEDEDEEDEDDSGVLNFSFNF